MISRRVRRWSDRPKKMHIFSGILRLFNQSWNSLNRFASWTDDVWQDVVQESGATPLHLGTWHWDS